MIFSALSELWAQIWFLTTGYVARKYLIYSCDWLGGGQSPSKKRELRNCKKYAVIENLSPKIVLECKLLLALAHSICFHTNFRNCITIFTTPVNDSSMVFHHGQPWWTAVQIVTSCNFTCSVSVIKAGEDESRGAWIWILWFCENRGGLIYDVSTPNYNKLGGFSHAK